MRENSLMKKVGWMHILLFLSMNAMSLMFAFRYGALMMLIHIFMSVFVSGWLIFKRRIFDEIVLDIVKTAKPYIYTVLQAFVIGIFYIKKFYSMLFKMFEQLESIVTLSNELEKVFAFVISSIVFVFSVFAIFVFCHLFNRKISEFITEEKERMGKSEKRYIKIFSVVSVILIVTFFNLTNIFYLPKENGYIREYDVVYTGDTGNQLWENVWFNISASENDIRQPLFGVFAIPFAAVLYMISKVLFFIPNCYAILMAIMQAIIIAYMYILISRLLKLSGVEKILFLVLATFTYPFLLFSFNMEQYVFATFWLVMMIYSALTDRKNIDYLYVASTGSMLTSGIFFFLLSKAKNLKDWIKDILKVAVKFLNVTVISGQFIIFVLMIPSLKALSRFSGGEISFGDKLLQFFNFIATSFIRPKARIDTTSFKYISWQLVPVNTLNIMGIVLLIAAICGFVLNRKDKFAQLCMTWVSFSFLILCLIGWGTKENGLVLYTLYFSWAYISLLVLLLKKIFKNEKVRSCVYLFVIVSIAIINIPAIYDLIKFGMEYYPVIR